MFRNWFKRPLELDLGERVVRFDTLGDFEFSLSSRTDVPAAKVGELVRFEPEALRREASDIREVERRFVQVLSQSLASPGTLGHLLREIDTKLFSHDHDWREIMRAVIEQSAAFEEYKKIALAKYMQYLGSRQEVLRSIYVNKHAIGEPEPEPGSDRLRETIIFDLGALPRAHEAPGFQRLPRGESVAVTVPPGRELQLVLSRHPFTLVSGARPRLVDGDGRAQPLQEGRNLIGRQPDGDVVVEGGLRDVSRQHLIIVAGEEGEFTLTDVSSHGTFVQTDALCALEEPTEEGDS